MLRHLFERKADARDQAFAEAQALLDDGLDLDFVLSLFPEDAEWLRPELAFGEDVVSAIAFEQPSYYFEASLKSKFVAAGRTAVQPVAPSVTSPFRTAAASMAVLAGAGLLGVLTLGFVTAGNSVPGDWNYSFKLGNERLQYALANGNARVDIQLRQTENRVYELRTLTKRGEVNASDIASLQRELQSLAELASQQQFDAVQRERLVGLAGTSKVVLDAALTTKPALDPSVNAAAAAADSAVTALGTPVVKPPQPTASPTATASPAAPTASATATGSATATANASPSATHTVAPASAATPAPTATATATATATTSPAP